MQVPQRKSQQFRKYAETDHHLTAAAITRLKADLQRLETARPKAVEDLTRAREMGDLSENAAYSQAKARLAGIDFRTLEIKEKLKQAVVITAGVGADGRIALGCRVTVEVDGKLREYEIVGAQEADPSQGRISHLSPVGQALIGKRVGETAEVRGPTRLVTYRVISVS